MLGPAEADHPRQPLRGAGARNDAQAELRLAELRRVGRDTEIAGQCQLAAATQGVAVDRRDRGPWKSLHRREERRVDRRQPFVSGSLAQFVDVRPRHERLVTGPGQNQHADAAISSQRLQSCVTLLYRFKIQCVSDLRPVECQHGDTLLHRHSNIPVGHESPSRRTCHLAKNHTKRGPRVAARGSPAKGQSEGIAVNTRRRPCWSSSPAVPPAHIARAGDTGGTSRPGWRAGTRARSTACRGRRDRPARTAPSGDSARA